LRSGYSGCRKPAKNSRSQCDHATASAVFYFNSCKLQGGRESTLKPEFISKLGVVVEETDETVFWLEFLADSGIVQATKLRELLNEAN
jgi:hypothetical protein